MKHQLYLLGLFFAIVHIALAKTVTPQKAKAIAQAFFNANKPIQNTTGRTISTLELIHTESMDNTQRRSAPAYYIFKNSNGKGFVIVSGDDVIDPILGYSFKSSAAMSEAPHNFLFWMSNYKKAIHELKKNNARKSFKPSKKWHVTFYDSKKVNQVDEVPQLIHSEWRQYGKGTEIYNNLCPIDRETGLRSKAGCGAVAMGQIMRYHRYPSHYKWSDMPNALTAGSSNTQKNAVAKLLFEAGTESLMNYGSDVSITNIYRILKAFKFGFGYNQSATIQFKNNMEYDEWVQGCEFELNNSRPFLMRGGKEDGSGHFWVCDGYNKGWGTYFHMNWGHYKSFDGHFPMFYLPGFDVDVCAIVDIKKPTRYQSLTYDATEVLDNNSKLTMYPNPVHDYLFITSPEALENVSCFSVSGKNVSVSLDASNKISVAHLPKGLYFLKIKTTTGQTMFKQFIK